MKSDVLQILPQDNGTQIEIWTEEGSYFSLPKTDCLLLPLIHTTAEEFAEYIWKRLYDELGGWKYMREERRVTCMEVAVAERPIQRAYYKKRIIE